MTTLQLFSKPVDASGGMVADAILKLLGTHETDHIRTMVREAVQNSGDARLGESAPTFRMHVRTLTQAQGYALITSVLTGDVIEKDLKRRLKAIHNQPRIPVIEISDHGTCGLAGPDRADVATGGGDNHWASFVLNIGQDQNKVEGGGTYGFGKSSLYVASRASTVCIYTRTRDEHGEPVSRFIAAALSAGFEHKGLKHSGRHWWGVISDDGEYAAPVTGADADRLADSLGMKVRDAQDFGTTTLVLQPFMGDEKTKEVDTEGLAGVLHESLMVHCWPLMHPSAAPSMHFELLHEGRRVRVADPAETPIFREFTECLDLVRDDDGDDQERNCASISRTAGDWSGRELGRLAWSGLVNEPPPDFGAPSAWSELDELFGDGVRHVARLRPVDLVVNYDPTTTPPDSRLGYAAVFRVASRRDVERAFAASEPPAHDDWKPSTGSEPARAVREAIRLYRKRLATLFAPPNRPNEDRSDGSLGALSNRLGEALGLGRGRSTRAVVTKAPEPGTIGPKKVRTDAEVEGLVQTGIAESDHGPDWREQTIAFKVHHATGTDTTALELRLGLRRDDGGVDRPSSDEPDAPRLLDTDIKGRNASIVRKSPDRIVVTGGDAPTCTLVIDVPANRVLDVNLAVEEKTGGSDA